LPAAAGHSSDEVFDGGRVEGQDLTDAGDGEAPFMQEPNLRSSVSMDGATKDEGSVGMPEAAELGKGNAPRGAANGPGVILDVGQVDVEQGSNARGRQPARAKPSSPCSSFPEIHQY
jgi:hypothetical protein